MRIKNTTHRMVFGLLAMLIVGLVLCTYTSRPVRAEDGVQVTKADIILAESMSTVNFSQGEEKQIKIPIKAVGTGYMNNPMITIDTSGLPFHVSSEFSLVTKQGTKTDSIGGTTTYLVFSVVMDSDAKAGNYKFDVLFTTVDTDNVRYTSTLSNPVAFRVNAASTKSAPNVKLTVLSCPDKIRQNSAFEITYQLENKGKSAALNLAVSFDELAAAGIRPTASSDLSTLDRLEPGAVVTMIASFQVGDEVAAGTKKFPLKVTWKDENNTSYEQSQGVYLQITKTESTEATLSFSKIQYKKQVEIGDRFDLSFRLNNIGKNDAYKATLVMDDLVGAGIIPVSTNDRAYFGDFPVGRSDTMTIPLTVSELAEPGIKKLTLRLSYLPTKTATAPVEIATSIYITVENTKAYNHSNLVVYNITQSMTMPSAGDVVTIGFDIQNKGTKEALRIKLSPNDLSNKTVSSADRRSYIYISRLKPGQTKHVQMKFQVEQVAEKGVVNINTDLTYRDSQNTEYTDKVLLYILNVQKEESNGVPKLIIADYDLGTDYLKAGEQFLFSFDVRNTHKLLSADNIKVTISSENNVYSMVTGSNSFYIDSIAPGEIATEQVNLKVKADCVSKAYPLMVTFEYEYEGMQKLENQINTGLKISETLNFQVMEIARPKLDNIVVGTYDMPVQGEAATMQFDFYNLGKSTLYNVTAKVKSDDFSTTKKTVFVGNTEAGKGATYELEVVPLIGGDTARGTLVITYEDSNGTQFKVRKKFSAEVGFPEEVSMDDYSMDMVEDEQVKPILEIWQFVIAEIVFFIVVIVVTSKIVAGIRINQLRRKLEKEAESDED